MKLCLKCLPLIIDSKHVRFKLQIRAKEDNVMLKISERRKYGDSEHCLKVVQVS